MLTHYVRYTSLLLVLLLAFGFAVTPASAQCSPDPGTPGNDDIECIGDFGLLDVETGDDTVTIDAGGATVLADGIVSGGGGTLYLVVFAGDTLETGDFAILMDGDGNIVAEGVINTNGLGFLLAGDGDITFGADDPNSHLTADDVAMWVRSQGNITNYGEVDAGTAGLLIGDLANLFNPDATSGTINNYGDVDGGLFGAAVIGTGTINNYSGGVIEGDIASVAAIGNGFEINNYAGATIEEGFMGAFGYGRGTMNNYGNVHADAVGMVFISQVSIDENALADLMAASDELEFIIGLGDLINSIEFEGQITVNNDGRIDAPVGVLLLGNGTVNNNEDGIISAGLLGIGAYGDADINNAGVIYGSFVGVGLIGNINIDTEFIEELFTSADPDAISDLGFLFYIAAALNAIEFEGGGTIINSGDIGWDEMGDFDPTAIGIIQLGNGNIVNTESGRVAGEYVGMGLYGNGNVINEGYVTSLGVGLLFIGDISFDDSLFFDIDAAYEMFADSTLGPINFGTGTITNSGLIEDPYIGIGAIGNVTINNLEDGEIQDTFMGIAALGPTVGINNAGWIDSADLGILAVGDNIVVNNSGVISDTYTAITVMGNGTVNHSGIIYDSTHGIAATGDVTVNVRENSVIITDDTAILGDDANQTVNIDGIVASTAVIPAIVDLGEGRDRVNLRDDAFVVGDIRMGSGDDTVQIASGARIIGVIDGGDEDYADVLIVGDEVICGEAEGASQRFFGTREFVAGINLADDTFTFDGEEYTIFDFEEGRSGVRQIRCFHFIEDGRINAYDMGAPVAGYCNALDGLNVWPIDTDGNGQVDFSVSGEQMRTALELAVTSGANELVAQGALGTSLWALASNEYQMMGMQSDGKTYAYVFEPGRCGPGGVYTTP